MDIKSFIDNVAAGKSAEAKEGLNDLLSARAFEALDAKKTEIAQKLFTGEQDAEQVEVQGTEETAE